MTKSIRRATIVFIALLCAGCLVLFGCGGGESDEQIDDVFDTKTETVYTVTFDLNYDGGASFGMETSDGAIEPPEDPERSGYLFSGWYADKELTISFDFTAVTSDATAYAGWLEVRNGYIYITYMYNYGDEGVFMRVEVAENRAVTSLPTVTRSGYLAGGWYTEPECVNRFTAGTIATESMTLYARWLAENIFEAEFTDLTDGNGKYREFRGYSESSVPVWSDSAASGGYYVGDMYSREAYIFFDIYSDRDVNDAVMYLNVAMAFGYGVTTGTVEFTNSDYTITVNDQKISYSTFSFDVSDLKSGEHTYFREVYIGQISLNEGWNEICFEVTNSEKGQGGTMLAKAPLVDYMKIYTDATLTWNEIDNSAIYVD